MRIGFLWYDGWIEATPACRRAVEIATSILEKEGHTLVPFVVNFTKIYCNFLS